MAVFAQATFHGADIIIRCDDRWDCCQREQAAAKVRAMNRELKTPPPKRIRAAVTPEENAIKEACQRAHRSVHKSLPAEGRASMAYGSNAPKCLAEKMADEDVPVQYDHPLDVKLGGDPAADLTPLEPPINGCFGSFAQKIGDAMLNAKPPQEEVASVSLVCPKSEEGCPKEHHSEGPRKKYKPGQYETTYTSSQL